MNDLFEQFYENTFNFKEYSFDRESDFDFNQIFEAPLENNKKELVFKIEKIVPSNEPKSITSSKDNLPKNKKRNYKLKPFMKEISSEEFNRRKWRKDSFLKKIRRIFFKYIKKTFVEEIDIKIKIPNTIKSNISLEFNKITLKMTVNEFFSKFALNYPEYLKKSQKNHLGIERRETPLFKLYLEFLESEYFQNTMDKLYKQEGLDFSLFINKFASEFLEFYLSS